MKYNTTLDRQESNKFNMLAAEWWDYNGPLKTLHDINQLRLKFLENSCSLKGKRILDVGCGGGIFSEALALKGATVTGIDVNADLIAVAASHALDNKISIQYESTLIEDFDAPAFDIVVCMELLEHISNPALLINHCARLLKSGGALFLSTINRTLKAYGSAIIAAEYLLKLLPRQTHDFDKFMTPAELATLLRKAGLQLETLQGFTYNPWAREAQFSASVAVNYLLSAIKL